MSAIHVPQRASYVPQRAFQAPSKSFHLTPSCTTHARTRAVRVLPNAPSAKRKRGPPARRATPWQMRRSQADATSPHRHRAR